MKFSFIHFELCSTTDKQAHFFTSLASRNGQHVVEINNKYFGLIVHEYVWRAEDAKFERVESGTYVFN